MGFKINFKKVKCFVLGIAEKVFFKNYKTENCDKFKITGSFIKEKIL